MSDKPCGHHRDLLCGCGVKDDALSGLFGIPVEVVPGLPPNTVLLVSEDMWVRIKAQYADLATSVGLGEDR